jgi:hypothetical protein
MDFFVGQQQQQQQQHKYLFIFFGGIKAVFYLVKD